MPLDVRRRLNVRAGDRLEFVELPGGESAIRPAVHDVPSLKGLLRKPAKPVSVEDVKAAVREPARVTRGFAPTSHRAPPARL
jgi:antitoxin PrlF